MMSERMEDNIEKMVGAIEMNTQAIAHLNKNLSDMVQEIKETKIEMQSLRRNSGYLRNIAEILNEGLK